MHAGHPLIALLAAALVGCAVGPEYRAPETALPARFTAHETSIYAERPAPADFWRSFNDDVLTGLVTDALAANHDLRIAIARVSEARAALGETRFDLAPTVTANGGYVDRQLAVDETIGGIPRDQERYAAAFDASWELDFFGRVRRGIEAGAAQLGAAEAALRDARLIVAAEVTRAYVELRGQQQQLEVARSNVANQSETLELTMLRHENGRATELDTSRAQAQLSTTRSTIAPLEAAIAISVHRLGVLTGRAPDALRESLAVPGAVPSIPAIVAISDPADLVRRRPDIRIAERELAGATARIGIAVADLFPRVSFTGSVGFAADSAGSLGEAGTGTRLVAPGISWAAFDLGRVRARIAASEARAVGAIARYEQTVLRALEDTENSLVAHARARDRLQDVEAAAKASSKAAELARLRYESGANDFLQVLDAERTRLAAEDRLAESRTATATTLVAVYKALGGGWESGAVSR